MSIITGYWRKKIEMFIKCLDNQNSHLRLSLANYLLSLGFRTIENPYNRLKKKWFIKETLSWLKTLVILMSLLTFRAEQSFQQPFGESSLFKLIIQRYCHHILFGWKLGRAIVFYTNKLSYANWNSRVKKK